MFGRRRRRSLTFLIGYLLVLVAGALALWMLIPDDVKKTIYETYINPS